MIVSLEEIRAEKPGVPSPVAYRSMRSWQRGRAKRPGQCSPPKGHEASVRTNMICEHRSGWDLGFVVRPMEMNC